LEYEGWRIVMREKQVKLYTGAAPVSSAGEHHGKPHVQRGGDRDRRSVTPPATSLEG
jgi:hypothetical protein